MSDAFYRAFEDRYRGSRELIKARLNVYKQFIEPLATIYAGSKAVDLGCGRGEWLELVNGFGFAGVGVDMDNGMLEACYELGLNVEQKEAIAYLRSLPKASISVISAFHVVEHISFSDLQTLVQEALRALLPGGILILETPNPENIVVAGSSFYLDPTHQRPIPPQLLSFLPEHYGYERVKVLRLQEDSGLIGNEEVSLLNVLAGVSPDYAVIAQKVGPKKILAATETPFKSDYGVTLESLAGKYEQQRKTMEGEIKTGIQLEELKTGLAEANSRTQKVELIAELEKSNAQKLVAEANGLVQLAEAKAQQAEAKAQQVWIELQSVYHSHSWRITWPIRKIMQSLRTVIQQTKLIISALVRLPKRAVKWLLTQLMLFVLKHGRLKRYAMSWLNRRVALKQRLKEFARAKGVTSAPPLLIDNNKRITSDAGSELMQGEVKYKVYNSIQISLRGVNASQSTPLETNIKKYIN